MKRRFFAILLTALAGGGFALAQAPTGEDPATPPVNPSGGPEIPEATDKPLTPAEQLADAQRIVEEGETIAGAIATALTDARKEKDVMLAACLEDKDAQAGGNLETLKARNEALQAAAESGNAAQREHEYVVITVLGQKMTVLKKDADRCIGEGVYQTSPSDVAMFIDPGTPLDDGASADTAPDTQIPFIPPPTTSPM